MKEAIENLKEWGKDTQKKIHEAKVLELEAVIRFILNNQPYDAFYLHGAVSLRGEQGMMWLSMDDGMPVLYVNWDECNPFDDQQELFEELFEGDFSGDKLVKITGIKI